MLTNEELRRKRHKGTGAQRGEEGEPRIPLRPRATMLRNATHGTAAGQVTRMGTDGDNSRKRPQKAQRGEALKAFSELGMRD